MSETPNERDLRLRISRNEACARLREISEKADRHYTACLNLYGRDDERTRRAMNDAEAAHGSWAEMFYNVQ